MKNRRWLFLLLCFCFLGLMAAIFLRPKLSPNGGKAQIIISGHTIWVEVADTPKKRTQGLSGRNSMPVDQGMLFIFPKANSHSFWMKEMKFNLDFVFINGDQVVELVENVPFPDTGESPQTVKTEREFDQVLELNQGVVKELKINIGDTVGFSL